MELLLIVESAANTLRLIVEFLQSEPCRCREMLAFTLFILSCGVSLSDITDDEPWASILLVLPTGLLIIELLVIRAYSYAVLAFLLSVTSQQVLRIDFILVLGYAAQLIVANQRSNTLRILSTASLLFAATSDSLYTRRLAVVVALEFNSWAMERYMLPWRIPSGSACCNYATRFALGFFIGAHITSGSAEQVLLRRNPGFLESFRGFAIHGSRAHLRFSPRPLGILLAYIEGLQLIPFELTVDGHVISLRVLWFDRCVVIDTINWSRADDDESFAAASRFPVRRIFAGLLLRMNE